uniref:Uncharacterized protein n=1 Tax=Cannabis sativa TaxID=3483 RepID=A0A803QRB9_CANSA
ARVPVFVWSEAGSLLSSRCELGSGPQSLSVLGSLFCDHCWVLILGARVSGALIRASFKCRGMSMLGSRVTGAGPRHGPSLVL